MKRRMISLGTSRVSQLEEQIRKLEEELAKEKERTNTYQQKAAKYRTLYYSTLRRYQHLVEDM